MILSKETSYEDECFKSVDAKEANLKKSAFSNVSFEYLRTVILQKAIGSKRIFQDVDSRIAISAW